MGSTLWEEEMYYSCTVPDVDWGYVVVYGFGWTSCLCICTALNEETRKVQSFNFIFLLYI